MNIALISPYPDITAFGLRTISAYLRRHGHATRLFFLPDPLGDDLVWGVERYSPRVLDRLTELCADCGLIGIGLMTNYFDNARQISTHLRARLAVPLIWGGVHPTIRPAECLEFADYVCVGDGEEAVLDLVQALERGEDTSGIANIWTRRGTETVQNPVRPLLQDLDSLPHPDYSHEGHYVMVNDELVPLTPELTQDLLATGTGQILGRVGYQTMTGRGCPHKCTYCINDALRGLYGSKGYLRWRGNEHVMLELERVRELLPRVELIWISDDAFFGRDMPSIREFCTAYKARIGLPFFCLASPMTMSEEKLATLIDAGLVFIQMGVQTGSPRIQELFNRKAMHNEKMLAAMRMLNAHKHELLPPSYDIILDTPYETLEDKRQTVLFISRIPKPFRLQTFSLVLFPGTRLHEQAVQNGLLKDEQREVYAKSWARRNPDYFNLLVHLAKGGGFPSPLLRLLASRPVAAVLGSKALDPVFRGLFPLLRRVKQLLGRGARGLARRLPGRHQPPAGGSSAR